MIAPTMKENVSNGKRFYECTKCKNSLGQHYYNFCPHCGERLRQSKKTCILIIYKTQQK